MQIKFVLLLNFIEYHSVFIKLLELDLKEVVIVVFVFGNDLIDDIYSLALLFITIGVVDG
jgi:hypothetical protein